MKRNQIYFQFLSYSDSSNCKTFVTSLTFIQVAHGKHFPLDICSMLLAGLKKKKNDVTEVSMSVANIWKAAQGDCNISIFVQYCLPRVQWWQDCGFWLLPWLLQRVAWPPLGNHKQDDDAVAEAPRCGIDYSQSASHWEGVSYGQWANKRCWWLASKSRNSGLVPRLKIHKPAIGTGFKGHFSNREVALKIPRLEGYQGGCATVFGIVDGWT